MLGIDARAVRYTWTAAALVLLLALVYAVRKTLFIFILAVLFAYLLSPLVNLLNRFLPTRKRRTPALLLAYVILVGLMVLVGTQIGSRVVNEAKALTKDLPAKMADWEKPSPNLSPTANSLRSQIVERVRGALTEGSADLVSAAAQAGMKFITVASDAIYIVIIPILAFFFLKDGHVIREHVLDMVQDGPQRLLADDVLEDIHLLLAHYMRALVLLSAAAFTAYSIFFSIMGVPYGVLLAALGGMLEFIPMLGPLTAGIIIVVVSALSGSHAVGVIIFLLAYRVFQDYILSPHLMERGVELHPLFVLFGVFAGAEVAGIAGTFLSVPILAMVRILFVRIRKARMATSLAPEPTVTR
jgi:predicted PurR-regulated permease PerM